MMKLEGIHHITAITGDAPRNVDFYARVLGLRLVKKTVNQDDPTVYHLFYADEPGSAGSDLTFFEYPQRARRAGPGAGMVHRIAHRVASADALDFWADRLGDEGVATTRAGDGALRFDDPEGLSHELVVVDVPGRAAVARARPRCPDEHALQGFHAVYAAVADPRSSAALLTDVLGVDGGRASDAFEVRGDARGGLDPLRGRRGPRLRRRGHGPPHRVRGARSTSTPPGASTSPPPALQITPVIDRFYFRSVYFREPGGILYELASIGPGFTTDEPLESLGERLALPPDFERLRGAGRAAADAASRTSASGARRQSRERARRGRARAAAARRRRSPARRAGRPAAISSGREHRARAGRQPVGALDDAERAGADAVVGEPLQQRDARRSRRARSRRRASAARRAPRRGCGSAARASSGSADQQAARGQREAQALGARAA